MSLSVSICLVNAATTSETAYKQLIAQLSMNTRESVATVSPCRCDHPCARPDVLALVSLMKRVRADLKPSEQGVANAVSFALEGQFKPNDAQPVADELEEERARQRALKACQCGKPKEGLLHFCESCWYALPYKLLKPLITHTGSTPEGKAAREKAVEWLARRIPEGAVA